MYTVIELITWWRENKRIVPINIDYDLRRIAIILRLCQRGHHKSLMHFDRTFATFFFFFNFGVPWYRNYPTILTRLTTWVYFWKSKLELFKSFKFCRWMSFNVIELSTTTVKRVFFAYICCSRIANQKALSIHSQVIRRISQ